jgi:hypothetical protein
MSYTLRINRVATASQSREAGARLLRTVLREVEAYGKAATLGGPYTTGRLSNSIHSQGPTYTTFGVTGSVGSKLPYAALVHSGAKVHAIFPKGTRLFRLPGNPRYHRRPQLKFYWRRVGKVVWLPQVPGSAGKVGRSHPGQRGKQYLREGLEIAARRHQMHLEDFEF